MTTEPEIMKLRILIEKLRHERNIISDQYMEAKNRNDDTTFFKKRLIDVTEKIKMFDKNLDFFEGRTK
jgi:hypothetical protein